MTLSPELRRALLELTYLLDKLSRCPRPAHLDDDERAECSRFDGTVVQTLARARTVLDLDPVGDMPGYDLRPGVHDPSASLGQLMHARKVARMREGGMVERRPRA